MKKTLTLSITLFLLFTLVSCKKKTDESQLNGTWELSATVGGQFQLPDPAPSKPGNGNVFKFTNTNYERYIDGKLWSSGTYTIQKDERQINNAKSNYSLDLSKEDKVFINLSGNKLIVFYGSIAADGFENHYTRQ